MDIAETGKADDKIAKGYSYSIIDDKNRTLMEGKCLGEKHDMSWYS